MWKYVSRRIKDTFERNASYFDVRSAARVANTSNVNPDSRQPSLYPCRWRRHKCCWNSNDHGSKTNERKWYYDSLNKTWIGALTWSSALVLGWYASQFIHLKRKYSIDSSKCLWKQKSQWTSFFKPTKALPSSSFASENSVWNVSGQKLLNELNFDTSQGNEINVNSVRPLLINNDHNDPKSGDNSSGSESNDLSDVLNSIENKLGLAAIENGQFEDGLNMIKSAAHRHHPPALYNLALCYELGVGLVADEKMAMELYKLAATLEHPRSMYNLAVYYGQGRGGLTKDNETALRLLKMAAMKGQKDAIKALKENEVVEAFCKSSEPIAKDKPKDSWSYPYDFKEDLVPTQSTLFVEQINSMLYNNNCGHGASVY